MCFWADYNTNFTITSYNFCDFGLKKKQKEADKKKSHSLCLSLVMIMFETLCVTAIVTEMAVLVQTVVGYLTDVLEDAKLCSSHANKKSIDLDDIKLAIQFKLDHSHTNPPPRDVRPFSYAVRTCGADIK